MSVELIRKTFRAMGGPCEIHLWGTDQFDSSSIFRLLEDEVKRLEAKYSRFKSTSLLSRINCQELNGIKLDEETIGLLRFADQCYELSGHMFDPTVGILRHAWDFKIAKLPGTAQIERLKPCIGWEKVNWTGSSLVLPEGMEIDLGGLVKEFAADRLSVILQENGISGLVNLAGDITASGAPPDGKAWKVAIQHPRSEGAIATLDLFTGAIAGSGDYERFIEVDGTRYCHLLNPMTGFPATEGSVAVSVVGESCLLAGSVSTIAMLKGEEGVSWLEDVGMPYIAFDQSLNAVGSIEV